MTARSFLLASLATIAIAPSTASAQGVDIEFVEGPILGSNRIMGMGGAFVSVAEGADAHLFNPASYAMRYTWNRDEWFDWDWSIYWLADAPGDASNPDVAGESSNYGGSFLLGFGLDMRLSGFGFGTHGITRAANFIVELDTPDSDGQTTHNYQLVQTLVTIGIGTFFRGPQIAVGLGLNSSSIALTSGPTAEEILRLQGGGLSLGAVWAPEGRNYRLGVDYRSPMLASESQIAPPDHLMTQSIDAMRVPGRFTAGGSYMLWERNYNPTFTLGLEHSKPESERVGPGKRRYVLIAADLAVFAPSENAISANSFLDQTNIPSGEDITYQPRLGIESEFWANRMRARMGTYYEPSRVEDISGRIHWTAGADLRIGFLTDWRINTVIDVASGFVNWGLGVGFWN